MTLLRRAPREVYRVYSEEEFLADAASVGPFQSPVSPGSGERRLRRLAGVAALAGAVGAVGVTFAFTGSRSARGAGRRPVADFHATARTRIATRTFAATGLPVGGEAAPPIRRSLAVTGSRRPGGEHRYDARSGDGARRWHGEGTRRYAALTSPEAPGPVLARPSAAPMDAVRLTASSTAEASPPQHAEFGFER